MLDLALILIAAIGGKCVGAYFGARLMRLQSRLAARVSVLLNTRGLTELIALLVGRELGLLEGDLYSLFVVMALVTTVLTGVLLQFMEERSIKAV